MHVRYGTDAVEYARGLARGEESCEDKALAMLLEIRKKAPKYQQSTDGSPLGREMNFQAVCNATVVKGADEYYRNMFFRYLIHTSSTRLHGYSQLLWQWVIPDGWKCTALHAVYSEALLHADTVCATGSVMCCAEHLER